jgi:flagellar biosynthetic protein FliP
MEEAALMPQKVSMLGTSNGFPQRARAVLLAFCCAIALFALPGRAAGAAPQSQAPTIQLPGLTVRGDSTSITILVLLTLLTLLPAILLSMTPFVRILIIFHFLRQALGTQTTPTNQTLIGLALFLTYFIMQPVGMAIEQDAIVPFEHGRINSLEALGRGAVPMRKFMLEYTREKDLALFIEMSKEPRPKTPQDLSMRVVIPAYILSELKSGFQIGAVLFLPFLVIDLVTASITTSIGMLQLPPVVISTPLKILLFVVADGWNLVVGSILKSFHM